MAAGSHILLRGSRLHSSASEFTTVRRVIVGMPQIANTPEKESLHLR